jgi:hypothetical protein
LKILYRKYSSEYALPGGDAVGWEHILCGEFSYGYLHMEIIMVVEKFKHEF